jgi:hypothetical protein
MARMVDHGVHRVNRKRGARPGVNPVVWRRNGRGQHGAAPRPPSHHSLRFSAADAIDSLPPRFRLAWSSTASDTTTSHCCASTVRARALANAGSTMSAAHARPAKPVTILSEADPASEHLNARLRIEPASRPRRIVPPRREIVHAVSPRSGSIPGGSTDIAAENGFSRDFDFSMCRNKRRRAAPTGAAAAAFEEPKVGNRITASTYRLLIFVVAFAATRDSCLS